MLDLYGDEDEEPASAQVPAIAPKDPIELMLKELSINMDHILYSILVWKNKQATKYSWMLVSRVDGALSASLEKYKAFNLKVSFL